MSTEASKVNMDELLTLVVEEGASDLHIEMGTPPVLRINGHMHALDTEPLRAEDTDRLMRSITDEDNTRRLVERGGSDFGFGFKGLARFRVSIFKQKGAVGMVLRQIPNKLLTLEQIGLSQQTKELLYKPKGLVLVTGPTGSGKSTTLASMINIINEERDVHIITVEDPIEFYHEHKTSLVIQREVGVDVESFDRALVAALRMDPDVVLVGEMRDLETMEAAISAAETGHLVFATLHTTGAARTVDRIVDAFPTNQQEQIRTQLASTLQAVISQVLIPREDRPGRVAAFEIMISTPGIQALIRDNKTYRITSDIQTGGRYGMITLDNYLINLYRQGIISFENMILKANDAEALAQKVQAG
jgi:twitching motility protein PilT